MDAVSQTGSQAAAPTARAREQHGTLINSDFQTFLVMLTTQMQNQDPLNPIDSTDYAAQLATFSGVEQQVKTNTLLESLSSQLGLSGMAQMASWVGMEARSAAPTLFDGAPLTLYPAPESGADQTVLVAYDSQGREVMRSPAPASDEPLVWAGTDSRGGPMPAGLYSFRLESYAAGEPLGISDVESFARIAEVQNGPDGPVVVLDGGAVVSPPDIKAMRGAGPQ
ncbi:flagellar hook assembly protein FlgD [Defluviimonas sp. WL0024]|uniref:Basal-body rod modification protein FlgD n=1 Tax=Albidovulum salinarum TaxID=2984153 RepID=A0ABT2X7N3_9RHOB|nr:flagellar hook capping FlgD N-terminal domain-containing protein [Defluviimonas sp. WL0024]MCU9849960.1 flagellar hook assembly protein FlgD [Defluviimonas sp. WL0024]